MAPDAQAEALARIKDVDRKTRERRVAGVFAVVACVATALWYTGATDAGRLIEGVDVARTLVSDMLPPDFSRWRDWVVPMVDSIAMSIAGTAIAVALCAPLAFLAAANTAPARWSYWLVRGVFNLMRALPELILGVLFVAAVGFGMMSGALALGLHSIGMVGKFFAESIEHVDPGPTQAIKATGAGPLQVQLHGVIPQVLPKWADIAMYRWEYNFRASTVMGMVGAGGIGTELIGALRILDYQQVAALLLLILAAVTVVDWLSQRLRAALL